MFKSSLTFFDPLQPIFDPIFINDSRVIRVVDWKKKKKKLDTNRKIINEACLNRASRFVTVRITSE